jgi:hypothetical protein
MDIIDAIQKQNYAATEIEVEQLAVLHADASTSAARGDSTYLKILVASCQAALGKGRRKSAPNAHSQVLQEINERLYPAVLRGVTTSDIVQDPSLSADDNRGRRIEMLRRATFARSAKSTLDAYIKAMGDIRSLDVAVVTKTFLRKYINEQKGESPVQTMVTAARDKVIRECRRLAEKEPDAAMELLEAVIAACQETLDDLETQHPQEVPHHHTTTIITPRERAPIREAVVYHSPRANA